MKSQAALGRKPARPAGSLRQAYEKRVAKFKRKSWLDQVGCLWLSIGRSVGKLLVVCWLLMICWLVVDDLFFLLLVLASCCLSVIFVADWLLHCFSLLLVGC